MTEAQATALAWELFHQFREVDVTPIKSRQEEIIETIKEGLMSAYNDGWENGFESGFEALALGKGR